MLFNDQKIKVLETDSSDLIVLINQIISSMVFQYKINDLYYVRIKNWFNHKWLNFSGIGTVPFESGGMFEFDMVSKEKWQDEITVPPFNPNRILSETYVIRDRSENNSLEKFSLHKKTNSQNNLQNRIFNYSQNGIFVWYSSNSEINKRGSLMVYRVQGKTIETFYASLVQDHKWRIIQSKGIGLNELNAYIKDL
jgi:hypothetical protein